MARGDGRPQLLQATGRARKHVEKCALATATSADDGEELPCLDGSAELVQDDPVAHRWALARRAGGHITHLGRAHLVADIGTLATSGTQQRLTPDIPTRNGSVDVRQLATCLTSCHAMSTRCLTSRLIVMLSSSVMSMLGSSGCQPETAGARRVVDGQRCRSKLCASVQRCVNFADAHSCFLRTHCKFFGGILQAPCRNIRKPVIGVK